jgi:hypothetical protein
MATRIDEDGHIIFDNVGSYECPTDPMERLNCDSCQ